MDPRQQRTTDTLRSVVFALAAEQPIESVTVSEISRRAGITRATFYNQAASPADLLARFLTVELDDVRNHFFALVASDGIAVVDAWSTSEQELVAHLIRHAAIYEAGLSEAGGRHLGPTLRALLVDHIELSLHHHLRLNPGIVPRDSTATDDADSPTPDHASSTDTSALDFEAEMHAAFAAQGLVGALEVWLRSGEARSAEEASRIILRSMPAWWFSAPPQRSR